MKKILITGANSYIGTSFEKWLAPYPDKYLVDTVDMIGDAWKKKDFSRYDVVFHVAGIAHQRETKRNKDLYYKVNRDLAFETAKKAKTEGVTQFIFLSSMSVYGIDTGIITKDTPLDPNTNYGKSKLEAEKLIRSLEDDTFKVAILRPPMVYGKGCPGNYPKLARLAVTVSFFPDIDNRRSMIYIDNLCDFIRMVIEDCKDGIFVPQNSEYVKTSEMVSLIAQAHGKKIRLTKIFNPLIRVLNINIINKIFGDLVYEEGENIYRTVIESFSVTIAKTEGKE